MKRLIRQLAVTLTGAMWFFAIAARGEATPLYQLALQYETGDDSTKAAALPELLKRQDIWALDLIQRLPEPSVLKDEQRAVIAVAAIASHFANTADAQQRFAKIWSEGRTSPGMNVRIFDPLTKLFKERTSGFRIHEMPPVAKTFLETTISYDERVALGDYWTQLFGAMPVPESVPPEKLLLQLQDAIQDKSKWSTLETRRAFAAGVTKFADPTFAKKYDEVLAELIQAARMEFLKAPADPLWHNQNFAFILGTSLRLWEASAGAQVMSSQQLESYTIAHVLTTAANLDKAAVEQDAKVKKSAKMESRLILMELCTLAARINRDSPRTPPALGNDAIPANFPEPFCFYLAGLKSRDGDDSVKQYFDDWVSAQSKKAGDILPKIMNARETKDFDLARKLQAEAEAMNIEALIDISVFGVDG